MNRKQGPMIKERMVDYLLKNPDLTGNEIAAGLNAQPGFAKVGADTVRGILYTYKHRLFYPRLTDEIAGNGKPITLWTAKQEIKPLAPVTVTNWLYQKPHPVPNGQVCHV